MEYHALYPRTVLRVRMNCREKCPRIIKTAFLEINDVDSVVVDPEEMLVYVTGKVDPRLLLKATQKIGKTAEILFYEKEPRISERNHNGKGKSGYSCSHKAEDYVPPKFDERICRDPFCKLHKSRPFITQRIPSKDFAHHPHHTACGGNSFHDYYYPYPQQRPFPGMSRHGYGFHGDRDDGCTTM